MATAPHCSVLSDTLTPLFALQLITADDAALIIDALRSRRLLNAMRIDSYEGLRSASAPHCQALRLEIERIDQLTAALQTTRHHEPAARDHAV